jgi:hypothetical protein
MKTEQQITEKVDSLFQKRLKQRKEKFLAKHHRNCLFNLSKDINGEEHCFCTNVNNSLVQNELIFLCENIEVCERCSFYQCKNTEKSVEEQMIKDISDPSICGIKEPKLAVLLWVLNDGNKSLEKKEQEKKEQEKNSSFLLFFKKLFFRKEK